MLMSRSAEGTHLTPQEGSALISSETERGQAKWRSRKKKTTKQTTTKPILAGDPGCSNCGDLCSQDSLITQLRHLHTGFLKTLGAEVRLRLLSYLLEDVLIKQSLN